MGLGGVTAIDHKNYPAYRRAFLRAAAGGVVGLVAGPVMAATGPAAVLRRGELSFRHLHTGEHLTVPYRSDDHYSPDARAALDHLLRDFRTGEEFGMDTGLLDILYRVRTRLESHQPFEIISGYRSPRTNAQLAAKSGGVAKRSYHMRGMAIDIRLPGRRLRDVRRAALDLRLGGVGYYARSNFVHLDTGRVRFW